MTDAGQFAGSHGSYDFNLGSKILILDEEVDPISVGHTVYIRSQNPNHDKYQIIFQRCYLVMILHELYNNTNII